MYGSRRDGRSRRPQVEGLEGRLVLSAGGGGSLAPSLSFRVPEPGLFSQQASSANLALAVSSPRRLTEPLTVQVDTVDGGTAVAGQQYLPLHQTVTFQPGERSKTISVPLVPGAENPGKVTVGLMATPLTPDSQITTTKITIDRRSDVAAPKLTGARLVVEDGRARGIELSFSEPMDLRLAQRVSNYVVWDYSRKPTTGDWFTAIVTAGRKNPFQPISRLVKSATYDPLTRTVLIATRGPLAIDGQYDVTSGARAPSATTPPKRGGLADASGNLLGHFHVSVGTKNKANDAGTKTTDVLNKLPRL